MSQYQTLLREQAQLYEGSPTAHNYAIYPSPDRYRQNSIGLNFPLENDVQNYYKENQNLINDQNILLKAAVTKELQGNNYDTLNSLNYNNSKIINNQDIWDELNNASDSSSFSQAIICPTYLTQEPVNIDISQKSLISFGNITPISPNHNKLLANCNLVGSLPNNELSESSNYIPDINSFKENIESIQQQSNLINSIDTNMLSLTTSSLSFTDLKAINNGEFNLVTSSNNAELMAANTLLGPKSNSNKKPLLNDVSLIPSNNYTQDSMLPTIAGTPVSTPKMTTTVYAQSIGKINNTFFSPVLSPAISQIYPSDVLKNQEKSISSYTKPVKYEKMKMKNNTVPLIKTSAINKKLNKISNYISIGNLKAVSPFTLKTDFLNKKNEESLILNNMEIDQKDMIKEERKQVIEKEVIKPTENQINSSSNVDTSTLNQTIDTKPLSIIPISSSPEDFSIKEINHDNIEQEKQIIDNTKEKKEEIILNNENVNSVTQNNGDNKNGSKLEMDKMEIEKPFNNKDESKEEVIIESTMGNKKDTTSNKVKAEIVKEKKEAKTIKTSKVALKKDENKKKEKKKKENVLPDTTSKEKSKIKKDKILDKDSTTTKKETDILKKNTNSKDNESLSGNTSPKIKKKPRFSAKKAKNDPAALEEHILLKRKRNTEAARRSRQRKVQQMKNLEEAVARLTKELEQANEQLKASQEKYEKLVDELKNSKETYENKIKLL